jgi:conjugal transfer pilus assembly protein TraV
MRINLVFALLIAAISAGCTSITGMESSRATFACKAPDGVSAYNPSVGSLPIAFPGMPIRSQSKTLRVWVTPWTDDDGDLHDQTFVYLLVDPGRWMIEHTRSETVKRSLVRLKPLPVTSAATAAPQTNDQGRQTDSTHTDAAQSIRSFNPEKTE